MVPSPIVMQDERLDFSRPVLPERRTTEVSVLFATTRAPAPADAPERFTRRPAWRGLVHGPGLSTWTFPDDYPRRVGDAVYQTAPEVRREAR
jgi:hypothetical protein